MASQLISSPRRAVLRVPAGKNRHLDLPKLTSLADHGLDRHVCNGQPWRKCEETHMVPRFYYRRTKQSDGQRVGDEAEKKVFYMLETFGKSEKQQMIVLSNFKFEPLAKYIVAERLEEATQGIMEGDATEGIMKKDGEIDFLIIHRHLGLILMEVKGMEVKGTSEEATSNASKKAKQQLETAKRAAG